jgi:hypothetical protein
MCISNYEGFRKLPDHDSKEDRRGRSSSNARRLTRERETLITEPEEWLANIDNEKTRRGSASLVRRTARCMRLRS